MKVNRCMEYVSETKSNTHIKKCFDSSGSRIKRNSMIKLITFLLNNWIHNTHTHKIKHPRKKVEWNGKKLLIISIFCPCNSYRYRWCSTWPTHCKLMFSLRFIIRIDQLNCNRIRAYYSKKVFGFVSFSIFNFFFLQNSIILRVMTWFHSLCWSPHSSPRFIQFSVLRNIFERIS